MADKPWIYGSTVENGGTPNAKLRYLSCSTIEKCDASSNKSPGCLRKWFYEKVLEWKAEERTFAALGKQCHAEIETYLTTGTMVLGRITGAAKRYIPEPDPEGKRLLVEFDLGRRDPTLATAALHCAGVPMVGFVDLMHAEPAIDLEGTGFFNDPAGTVEILDWKFGAAKRDAPRGGQGGYFGKEARDLPVDTQMVTYANWFHNATGSKASTERLSHVYTNTKGRPEAHKVSILVEHEGIARRWEYIESVGRTIKDVVRESDVEKVPANTLACESFGGCPYAEQCTARKFNSLDSYWGSGTLEGAAIAGALQLPPAPEGLIDMGLIDALNLPNAAPAATLTPAAPTVTASPTGVAANLSIGAMLAGLQATPAPAAPPAVSPEFVKAIGIFNGKGYGFPTLIGRAATMLANAGGQWGASVPETITGFGDLSRVDAIEDPAVFISYATDMAGVPNKVPPDQRPLAGVASSVAPAPAPVVPVAAPAPATMGILPTDAPASNPALAAVAPPGVTLPVAVTAPVVNVTAPPASSPTEVAAATANAVNATMTGPGGPLPEGSSPNPVARKKRGPNKPKAAPDAPASSGEAPEGAAVTEGSWLFVNAIPSIAYENLQSTIDTWLVGLARHYKIEPSDVRCAPDDSPLSFGKWKGLITSVARRAAATGTFKPGAYYLDLRGSEINQAVFDGLRAARIANTDGTDGDLVFDLVVRGHD